MIDWHPKLLNQVQPIVAALSAGNSYSEFAYSFAYRMQISLLLESRRRLTFSQEITVLFVV